MKGTALSQEPNFPEDQHGGVAVKDAPEGADDYAGYESYFSTQDTDKHYLPDGKQYVVLKYLSERDRMSLERATRSSTVIDSKTRDMRIDLDDSARRHEAIKASVMGWHLVRIEEGANGRRVREVPFSQGELLRWLDDANPTAVDDIYKRIREMNPWLGGEENIEDLKEQRDELNKRIAELEDEEARKASSSRS